MKRKIYLIIVFMFLITGCKEKIYTKTPDDIFFNYQDTVEVYSDITINDLLIDTNANVTSDDFKIDSDEIGTKNYKIYYKYNKKKYVYEVNINIVDTTSPKIFGGTSRTVLVDYSEDLCNVILHGDNYDRTPKCEIVGEYNTSEVGTYNLKMVVADSSENTTEKSVTLKVVKKIENTKSTMNTEKIEFQSVIEKYKAPNIEFGIDVSSWQKEVDFEKVKEAGATFVIIRIGFQKDIKHELNMDSYYLQNIENAKKAGLKVGVYLYTEAGSVQEIKEHALWVIERLNGVSLELPIAFDWENWSSWNKYKINFNDINVIANTFIKTVNEKGYTGMLYSSKNHLETMWENKNNNPVWLAHYTEETNYEGDYILWQLCDNGRISGIEGDVDINILINKQ